MKPKTSRKRAVTPPAAVRKVAAVPASPAATKMPNLGDCLRAIRFKRRLSLADVSAVTGIARSTLSRVETNQLSLTYDKLVQLSCGLQIDLTELLSSGTAEEAPATLTRRAVAPPGSGQVLQVGTSTYSYICTEMSAKRMTPMLAEVRAQTVEETNGLLAHQGEEYTYVLSGTVQLHTEFYEPLILETGASVYFDSTMRHTYVAVGDSPARILCICSVDNTVIQHALQVTATPADTGSRASALPAVRRTRSRRPE
jgi:transcriptional regulator with XRE-family HTH domain